MTRKTVRTPAAVTTEYRGVGVGDAVTRPDTISLEFRHPSELDDDVHAAAAGDGAALRRLYDALSPKIFGYLRLRGADDPEGLTNDVFLTVFLRLDKLKGGWQGFRALAFTVAHSRMVDDRRRRARQPLQEQYDEANDGRADTSVEQQALTGIADGDTTQLLALLPEDQRSVVILRILGDLSIAQTAAALGTSEVRVKKLQQRALFALRALVGPSGRHGINDGVNEVER